MNLEKINIRRSLLGWSLGLGLVFGGALQGFAGDPIPTPNWTDFYGSATMNGSATPVGSLVEAFDPQGVLCGKFIVTSAGLYGFMPVYGDDDRTAAVDEGAVTGDMIAFKLNGMDATLLGPESASWGPPPATQREMGLSITGATTGLEVVSLPGDEFAAPLDTVEFLVIFRNTGNVTDFYQWSISTARNWEIIAPSGWVYVPAGAGDHVERFKVIVPFQVNGNIPEQVTFSLTSGLDAANQIAGTVNIFVLVTDVDDDTEPALPTAFALGQNYPNPFNPSTKIPFSLPERASVTVSVYNIAGRKVDQIDLGELAVGVHEMDYDASSLASGVYLYKVQAGTFSAVRRMILLK